MKHCMVEDCPKPVAARGACATHYKRWSRGRADYTLPSPMDPITAGKLGGAIGGSVKNPNKGFGGDRQLAKRASVLGIAAQRRKRREERSHA